MSNSRPWIMGAAAVSVLLAVAGWFLLISPERSKASDLRSQGDTQRQANQQLQLDIAQLKAQFKTLPAKQAELAVIKRQMPSTPGLPTLIRNLSSYAAESGADLKSVAPGAPIAFTASSHEQAAGSVNSSTGGVAVQGASTGLVSIPVSVTVDGDYAQAELFLQKLQNSMTRVMWVNSLNITKPGTPDDDATSTTSTSDANNIARSPEIEIVISGSLFVLPDSPSAAAAGGSVSTGSTGATSTTGSAS